MATASFALLATTAARTALVLIALVIAIRLAGKRHTGEGSTGDILLVLTMANAVQNAMTKGDGHLLVALVSAATLLGVGWLIAVVLERRPGLQPWVSGQPTLLVHDGRILRGALQREHLTEERLMVAVRSQGLARVEDVKLAVLEVNGSISVIPKERERGGR
jgi:uncharacterized membrane protein YcaP (DUF421 family)